MWIARLRPALIILITLAVPVLLILISIRLLMTETYLQIEYHKPDFPADYYGFTLADRLYYAPFAVQYIENGAGIDYLGDLKKPDGTPFYNQRELDHMVDVKNVVRVAFAALLVTAILLAGLTLMLIRNLEGRRILRQGLSGGSLLTLVLLAGLVMLVVLNWDSFFTQFHELFFSNGTWLFDYSDSLIRLFPVRFWQDAALTIGGMSAAGAVLIMGLAWWWSRRDVASGR